MKSLLRQSYLTFTLLFVAASAWSQCVVTSCVSDTIVATSPNGCDAVVNYAPPSGIDTCNSTTLVFNYTGTIESWVVPAGVTSARIEARGAQGGSNTSSIVPSGLGAIMIGDFSLTPGETLSILVGQQALPTGGNGGGGGSFVVSSSGMPLIIAGGGGGSSGGTDSPDKHGQVGTAGGTGAGGGGLGGTAGNGGNIGASFAAGAGGGFFTDGADGWTANSGGDAYVNGGAGANVGFGIGGFGGGGNGSGYNVGGGGGGYSGGGAGSNSAGSGVGGGGGSINNGSNPDNTGGANTGNGMVIITYSSTAVSSSLVSGIGSGGTYPLGTTTDVYAVYNSLNDTSWCSVNVTVTDSVSPTITAPADVTSCDPVVNGISASYSDNCSATVTYVMSGATNGTGSDDASGETFSVGTTTVWYYVTDAGGNVDSAYFIVTINPLPSVTLAAFSQDSICVYDDPIALPTGIPATGTYSGTGVSGNNFDPAIAGTGTQTITYSYTDNQGCTGTATSTILVDACAGIDQLSPVSGLQIYPNPNDGKFQVSFDNPENESYTLKVLDVSGRLIYAVNTQASSVNETFDLGGENQGVYLVEIRSASSNATYRVVKNQ